MEKIGQGGYAQVFKKSPTTVLKILTRDKDRSGGLEQSLPEIDILFNVNNPNMIKGIELKYTDKIELTLPLARGKDLIGHLGFIYNTRDEMYKLSSKCLFSILDAVTCLRSARYLNFDIKLENILIDGSDFYLSDYGLSQAIKDLDQVIISKNPLGSFPYLAPESLLSNRYSFKSLSWVIGLIISELMIGKTISSIFKISNRTKNSYLGKVAPNLRNQIIKVLNHQYTELESGLKPKTRKIATRLISIINELLTVDEFKRPSPSDFIKPSICQYNTINSIDISLPDEIVKQVIYEILYYKKPYNIICLAISLTLRYLDQLPNENIPKAVKTAMLIAIYFYNDEHYIWSSREEQRAIDMIIVLSGIIYINPMYINARRSKDIDSKLFEALVNPSNFKDFLSKGAIYGTIETPIENFDKKIPNILEKYHSWMESK